MATTTTNNGWDIPQSSDYVKLGADAIATLGQDIDDSVGTGLLSWVTYAPTYTNFTPGNGTLSSAKYCKLGKTVTVRFAFTLGTTSAVPSGPIGISLPFNSSFVGGFGGWAQYRQASNYAGVVIVQTSRADFQVLNSSGTYLTYSSTSTSLPSAWGNLHVISSQFTYESV